MEDAIVYCKRRHTWEGERDASGVLHANAKFPDMKALADYVHSKGLKIGIYSSPGPEPCITIRGSLRHSPGWMREIASQYPDHISIDCRSFFVEGETQDRPYCIRTEPFDSASSSLERADAIVIIYQELRG